jgi:hypothetical protein
MKPCKMPQGEQATMMPVYKAREEEGAVPEDSAIGLNANDLIKDQANL